MIQSVRFRHSCAFLASALLLTIATRASAEVSNVDPLQVRGPDDADLNADLESSLVDQGRVRDNDVVLHAGAEGRTLFGITTPGTRQGLGAQVDTWFAVGEDQQATPKLDPAELVMFEGKVNYLYEALDEKDVPVYEIIPQYEFVTYPPANTKQNGLKWAEHWVGSDAWWMTPIEGVELGGGAYWDPRAEAHMFKGSAGLREFYQDAPFDCEGWQLLNFGNQSFHRYFAGTGLPPPNNPGVTSTGLTTINLGGRITLPLPWEEFWTYGQADWVYWLQKRDRSFLHQTGQNVGDFVISIGAEWRPE